MVSTIEGVIYAFFGFTIILVLIILTFLIIDMIKYSRITYVIRYLRQGRSQVFIDRAKVVKTEYGEMWRTKKTKRYVPIPPDESIDIDKKGHLFIESFWSESGDIVHAKADPLGFKPIHPTTVEQRMVYAQEIKRANEHGFKFFERYGNIIVVGTIVIVLFLLIFIFWKDLLEPAQNFANSMNNMVDTLVEVVDRLQGIINNEQIVRSPAPPDTG